MVDGTTMAAGIRGLLSVFKSIRDTGEVKIDPSSDYFTKGRITKLAKNLIIRPRIIISKKLEYMDQSQLKSIINIELKIFIANYIQAFKLLADVYDLRASTIISRLNSDALIGTPHGGASYGKHTLATFGIEDMFVERDFLNIDRNAKAGYEGSTTVKINTESRIETNDKLIALEQFFITSFNITLNTSIKTTRTNDDYTIDPAISDQHSISIPLVVYPLMVYTEAESLIRNLTSSGNTEDSFSERIDDYRSGAISLSDLIFATDLVKKYKNDRLHNNNNVATMIRGINTSSTIRSIVSGDGLYSRNYNIYILDASDKITLDSIIKGNIMETAYRNKMLDTLMAYSCSIVDVPKEKVTIFITDIDGYNVLSFKMLKKDKDTDINEVFKNIMTNKSPF